MKQPFVTTELLAWLDRVFPDKCPGIGDSDRAIWMAAGARQVVEHLKAIEKNQVKEAMK